MKRVVTVLLLVAAVLTAVVVLRTARLTSRQQSPASLPSLAFDRAAAAARLAGALRVPTISTGVAGQRDVGAFLALHDYLAVQFPRTSAALTREVVADLSLLYTWRGSRPDLPPLILLGHLDVVPAGQDLDRWTHPPFSGTVDDTAVWGRGSLDNKASVVGMLEAVEGLLTSGFAPTRTTYLAFGHNEEDGADSSGAAAIAALLAGRGVRDAWLLDEGGIVYDGMIGVRQPVALIGIGEKGVASLTLVVASAGGHASMPPAESAVGILARAVDRVERSPMPARLDGALAETFATLAPEMTWPMRMAFANLWLTRPLLMRQLAAQPRTNALVRTTLAPTMLSAGEKSNVLATSARATMNVRLLPGDTRASVLAHVSSAIADPRVQVAIEPGASWDPPALSATDTPGYRAVSGLVRAVFPEAVVAPFLTVVATDARHYTAVAPHIYRFLPVHQPGSLDLIHAPNEHIRLDVYERLVAFYRGSYLFSTDPGQ